MISLSWLTPVLPPFLGCSNSPINLTFIFAPTSCSVVGDTIHPLLHMMTSPNERPKPVPNWVPSSYSVPGPPLPAPLLLFPLDHSLPYRHPPILFTLLNPISPISYSSLFWFHRCRGYYEEREFRNSSTVRVCSPSPASKARSGSMRKLLASGP